MRTLLKLLTWFWGTWDGMIQVLIAFVVVEALSSILVTISRRSAETNWKRWISKQIALFLIVGIGNITDHYLTSGGDALRTIIILFYIGCEGAVILNNARMLGLPVPQMLTKFLMELCDDNNNDT